VGGEIKVPVAEVGERGVERSGERVGTKKAKQFKKRMWKSVL